MGNISDKLTYLNTTKTQLKGMINYGLDENNKITNETTFRDYVKSIFKAFLESLNNPNTLFINLPKKSQEGANITLNDTANAPMRIKLSASEISQDTTTGKNIFNLGSLSGTTEGNVTLTQDSDGGFILNGTANGAGRFKVALSTDISSAVTMYLKTPTADGNIMLSLRDSDSIQLSNIRNNNNTLVVGNYTPSGNPIHYLELGHITSGVQYNNYKFYVMVVNGTYSSSNIGNYEPYTNGASPNPSYTQDIHTISGNNKLVVNGKNLFDVDSITANTYLLTTGVTGTSSVSNLSDYISVKANQQYYLSYTYSSLLDSSYRSLCYYNTSKEYVSGLSIDPATFHTFTPAQDGYIRFSYDKNYTKIQLEKGSQATPNEPYVSQEANIDLGVENLWKPIPSATKKGITCSYDSEEGCYILNGTSTDSTSFYVSVSYPIGKYSLSANNDQVIVGGADYLLLETSGGTSTNKTLVFSVQNNSASFDVTSPISALVIVISSGKTYNNFKIYPQLEKGDKVHSFCKYGETPIEYCKTGNYEDEFIRTSGKNLFDETFTAKKYVKKSNGDISTSDDWSATDYIEIKPNTQYIYSGINNSWSTVAGTCFYDNNKTFISSIDSNTYSFTTPSNAKYIKISLNSETPINIMLNEGTTALPYEPYGSNEWYIKKSIGKVVLDGTEIWGAIDLSNAPDYKEIYTNLYDNQILWNTRNGFADRFSNYNNVIIPTSNITSECFSLGGDNAGAQGRIRFAVLKTTASSSNEWKTWLSTHNTEVYYILATPTYTPLIGTLAEQLENIYQKLKSFGGTTNISQVNNDLPFVLNVQALENLE